MNEDSIKSFLSLLESLPPTSSVTSRGYVDTSITEPRTIASPVLTATSHNISIATNNLAVPQVAIFIGQNGRDLSRLMMGAPSFNLEEVTYMPGSYFYVHAPQEYLVRGNASDRRGKEPHPHPRSRLLDAHSH